MKQKLSMLDRTNYNYEHPSLLSDRMRLFVSLYLTNTKDPVKAMRSAGFEASDEDLERLARNFLNRSIVKRYISAKMAMHLERLDVTVQRVINELACIAFVDVGEFFGETGKLRPIHEIPENARRALSALDLEQILNGNAKTTSFKAKMHSKEKALELIGKYLGMFAEKIDVNHGGAIQHNVKKFDLEERTNLLLEDKLNGILE